MKTFFLLTLSVLIVFSQFITWQGRGGGASGQAPIVYWVTDPHPGRPGQIALFQKWLKEKGHPEIDFRIDAVNVGNNKIVLQGVTGVAGDVLDAHGVNIQYFNNIGLLMDLTRPLADLGVTASDTFPELADELVFDGKLVGFPANVNYSLLVVNKDLFASLGLPLPLSRWTLDDFEKQGRAFVAKANAGRKRQEVFFASDPDMVNMRRSVGVGTFNETLTAPAFSDPAHHGLLKRYYRWTYEDHLIPTAAEIASFAVDSSYGPAGFQLLQKGNYGMVNTGRWCLTQMRLMGKVNYTAVENPHGGFPNVLISGRKSTVYVGSPNQKLAVLFPAFLASDYYNRLIVEDSDALPPDPKYMNTEAFLRPAKHTNEWDLHKAFAEAKQIALPTDLSPYVAFSEVGKRHGQAMQRFMNRIEDAEAMTARLDSEVATLMKAYLDRHPELQAAYDRDVAQQKKIDELKKRGEKIPLSWIKNPFLRAYLKAQGRTTEG